MSSFTVKEAKTGFTFNLLADNGKVIAVSEVYSTKAACRKGAESVSDYALMAPIEDQTLKNYEVEKNPKFEVFLDNKKEYRFRLKASNGEIIAASEGYATKDSCMKGIHSVKVNTLWSEIEEKESA